MSKLTYKELEKKVNDLEKILKNIELQQFWNVCSKSPIPTLVLSKDKKFIEYNEAMVELTGYTHEEVSDLKTMASKLFQDEKYRNRFIQITGKSQYQEKDINSDEFIITGKDGEYSTVKFFSIDIFHDGKPTGLKMVQGIKLTEQKQEVQVFRESHLKFNAVIKSLPDIVYRLDPNGRISFITDAVEKYGYTTRELFGKNIFELVHPEDREKAIYHINERRTGDRRTISFEIRLLTKYQVPVPFEVRSKGVEMESFFIVEAEGLYKKDKSETQNFLGTQGIARDITERKQLEEALKKSEKKYRSLFESSKDGIVFVDLQGNIFDANQAYLDMLGYTIEEIKKFTYQQLTPRRWKKIEEDIVKNQIQVREYSDEYEKEYIRKNGTIFPITIRTWLIKDEQGMLVGMWAIVRDITERKKAEESIKSTLKEKEILLKEIHHRVKNNMQIISSLLSHQADRLKNKKYRDIYYESINRVKTMSLIHELLYQSKDFAHINFQDYINNIIENLSSLWQKESEKIEIISDIRSIILTMDNAIPCGLIINELISNSFKHGFPDNRKGIITITMKKVKNKKIELKVCDNGVGIPETLDWKNTDSLGLHLVNLLAEVQLEGTIELTRTQGTEFRITFLRGN